MSLKWNDLSFLKEIGSPNADPPKKTFVVRQEMEDDTFQYVNETTGWVKKPS
jgi:hypothetical protein